MTFIEREDVWLAVHTTVVARYHAVDSFRRPANCCPSLSITRNCSEEREERELENFQEMQEVYEVRVTVLSTPAQLALNRAHPEQRWVLTDDKKRAAYDQNRSASQQSGFDPDAFGRYPFGGDSREASIHSLVLLKAPRRTCLSDCLEVASLVAPIHAPMI